MINKILNFFLQSHLLSAFNFLPQSHSQLCAIGCKAKSISTSATLLLTYISQPALITRGIKSLIAFAILCAATAHADNRVQLPVTTVNGHNYYYYDVQPKETIFSISQRLGISREAIIEANPSVSDGLRAYSRLYFPVENGEITEAPVAAGATTHTVAKGETLYGISHRYGISVDRLIELNPSARNGVKVGETLTISTTEAPKSAPTVPASGLKYTIGQGETLYRIASAHGLTVEQLLLANPGIDAFNYAAGTVITIPGSATATATAATETAAAPTTSTKPVQPKADSTAPAAPKTAPAAPVKAVQPEVIKVEEPAPQGPDSFDIAVMLPFMLNDDTPDRTARLYTDFYRGFLLAANELGKSGKPVRIHAYDTAANDDTIAALLARPEIKKMNLIVGPDNERHLAKVIESVDEDETFVFNPFVVKNTGYVDHANVLQPNIPQEKMYAKAADAFVDRLDGKTPVFIARIKGQAEKDGFVATFKQRLTDRNIEYDDISFHDVLEKADLEKLDSLGSYVFVPITGQRTEFLKFKDAIKDFAASTPQPTALFGYPDWVTFRGDLLDDLSTLNTTIYSRFYSDPDYYRTRKVINDFKSWYNSDPIDGAPLQALLGYDTAMYAINALRNNGGDFHLRPYDFDGLQNSYKMDDSEVEGLVNTSLLLLTFKPDGIVERIKL